jgi:beta-galactosidase
MVFDLRGKGANMFRYGADYYPEHWPETRWDEDAKLMQAAGFNIVRVAEFAWSLMEPEEGTFDFNWLDRAISVLAEHGIDIILGTPTAAPPPWLMHMQEDLFNVGLDGRRTTYGLRREYCPCNPLYHQYTERIVTRMAEHYSDNPAVIGWQIDNEFGERCYCSICRSEFHKWLQHRYGTLDTLNEKWGTIFWSHIYTEWEQIPVPVETSRSANPGLGLDYRRFMSDTYRAYQKLQIDIIRQHTSDQFITHNLMGFGFSQLDYYDNSADLDFVSWDNYMRMQWNMKAAVDPSRAALSADTMRGLKKQNFWVMEQQSGGGGWELVAVPPKPGEMRLWAYQSIAHGADGILYFRWRTCRTGTEQYWQGVLEHHGIPGRRYDEAAQMGTELQKIGELIQGSTLKSQVAVMQSYDSRFAFQIQPNNPRFRYEGHIQDIYRSFYNLNIGIDIVSEKDNLAGYKMVIVPAMYVLTEKTATNLERFAASGGVVVFTPRTGVKDIDNKVVDMKLPGLVSKMAGVEVEEYVSMPTDEDSQVQFGLPNLEEEFTATVWADVLKPTTAKPVASYSKGYYADQAAVTINAYGDGTAIYLGTMGGDEFYNSVVQWVLELADIKSILEVPKGVEVTERWQGNQRLLFVLNHTDESQQVTLSGTYIDLLREKKYSDEVTIAPFDVSVLRAP